MALWAERVGLWKCVRVENGSRESCNVQRASDTLEARYGTARFARVLRGQGVRVFMRVCG